MSPNPYILLRNLVTPNRWFTSNTQPSHRSKGRIEHWEHPVPGLYEFVPGRGWFLVAVDTDDGDKLDNPVPLTYCRALHRFMLKDDFESRKKWGTVKDENGNCKKGVLFRLDDGVTWIFCWDEFGNFDTSDRKIPYCIDNNTRKFRIMTATDAESISGDSLAKTTCQSSTPRSGTTVAPSMQSFVEGDVHSPHPAWISLPSTQPSTRPSTRPSSTHGSDVQRNLTRSTATTPPSLAGPETPDLDAPELKRKLRRLTELS